jgi:uncharacterized membrane protein YebE (DUF533 family)
MQRHLVALLLATATATATAGAFAADAAATATPRVDQRQEHQAARIDQGVQKGTLTPREQRRLHREQKVVAHAEAAAKADGTVTRAERRRLHHLQGHASRDIARQKHDAQNAVPSAPAQP